MNDEELFTGENICDISVNKLYVLKNSRNEKYIFDAVELEYFIRNSFDMLVVLPVPLTLGSVNPPFQNIGKVENNFLNHICLLCQLN